MRLSSEQVKALQLLLKDRFDLEYSDEQAQEAGLAILRFMLAKQLRARELQAISKRKERSGGRSL